MKVNFLIACAAAVASMGASLMGDPAMAVSHDNCQIHGFRTYSHRHLDPNDRVISCDRPVQQGRYPTAARCTAHAMLRGGAGPEIPGTLMAVEVSYPPDAPAYIRADSMNAACVEAIESCYHVAGHRRNVRCNIVDQGFVR